MPYEYYRGDYEDESYDEDAISPADESDRLTPPLRHERTCCHKSHDDMNSQNRNQHRSKSKRPHQHKTYKARHHGNEYSYQKPRQYSNQQPNVYSNKQPRNYAYHQPQKPLTIREEARQYHKANNNRGSGRTFSEKVAYDSTEVAYPLLITSIVLLSLLIILQIPIIVIRVNGDEDPGATGDSTDSAGGGGGGGGRPSAGGCGGGGGGFASAADSGGAVGSDGGGGSNSEPISDPEGVTAKCTTAALEVHNKLRQMHKDTPPMEEGLDFALSFTIKWATNLAENIKKLQHSSGSGYGENLYWQSWADPDPVKACKQSIMDYYTEIYDWNFAISKGSGVTGHFTQLVWTQKLPGDKNPRVGTAVAVSKVGTFVSSNYNPHGNMHGAESKYVKPLKSCDDDGLKDGLQYIKSIGGFDTLAAYISKNCSRRRQKKKEIELASSKMDKFD